MTSDKIEETAHEKDKETLTSGESKGVNKEDKRKREGKVLRVLLSGRWLPRRLDSWIAVKKILNKGLQESLAF